MSLVKSCNIASTQQIIHCIRAEMESHITYNQCFYALVKLIQSMMLFVLQNKYHWDFCLSSNTYSVYCIFLGRSLHSCNIDNTEHLFNFNKAEIEIHKNFNQCKIY